MPIQSKLSSVFIPRGIDLWQLIQVRASRFLDRTAYVEWPSGDSLTYRQFFDNVERAAGALWQMGVRKGDIVLIFSPNTIKTPVMTHALLSIGAITTACNPAYTANEVFDHLIECGSKYIVTSGALLPVVKEVQGKFSGTLKIICYAMNGDGHHTYKELLEYDGPLAPRVMINPDEDKSFLYFSSGTTGKPKGVVHTHTTVVSLIHLMSHPEVSVFEDEDPEAFVLFLPFFHIYGGITTEFFLLHGKTAVVMEYFDFENFMKLNAIYKSKSTYVVPPVAVAMVKYDASKFDLSELKILLCAAAPLGEDLEKEIMRKYQLSQVKQGYGLTEGVSHLCGKQSKSGSVGILLPNTECKVLDIFNKQELGPGKEGELCIRGPQLMKGYLNRPEATAETIDQNGWMHTGDMGFYDEDQEFFITGRRKELIKYKGFQVAPASLEEVLLTHDAVRDAAVIGVPDAMAGELPIAFVVLQPNRKATEDEIKQYIADRVAPFKKLRGGVRFVKEIPKSPSGKILRKALKDSLRSSKL